MISKRKIWWLVVVVLIVVGSGMGAFMVSEAKSYGYLFYSKGIERGATTLEEAIRECERYGEKKIFIRIDTQIGYGKENLNLHVKEGMSLVVTNNAHVYVGPGNLLLDGTIYIKEGVLDLNRYKGKISGKGSVKYSSKKDYIRREYSVNKSGDICFVANDLKQGQTLEEAEIISQNIYWKCSIPGEWQFSDLECCPMEGTYLLDIEFVPKNTLTYEVMKFSRAGKVTVQKEKQSEEEKSEYRDFTSNSFEKSQEPIVITQMASTPSTIISKVKVNAPRIKKIIRKKRKLIIVCQKRKNCRYEIRCATTRNMRKYKKIHSRKSRITIKNVKAHKKYYIRVRTYNKKSKQYSKWTTIRWV